MTEKTKSEINAVSVYRDMVIDKLDYMFTRNNKNFTYVDVVEVLNEVKLDFQKSKIDKEEF